MTRLGIILVLLAVAAWAQSPPPYYAFYLGPHHSAFGAAAGQPDIVASVAVVWLPEDRSAEYRITVTPTDTTHQAPIVVQSPPAEAGDPRVWRELLVALPVGFQLESVRVARVVLAGEATAALSK